MNINTSEISCIFKTKPKTIAARRTIANRIRRRYSILFILYCTFILVVTLSFVMRLNRFRYIFKCTIIWRQSENLRASRKETVKVIFDSNFFFIPAQFQLDIFEEMANLLNKRFDPILLSPTQKELQRLAEEGSPKTRQQASLGLKLAERCRLVNVERGPKETHDDVIVRLAAKWKCLVATNDRELRKRLRKLEVPVVFLRQRRRLESEGRV